MYRIRFMNLCALAACLTFTGAACGGTDDLEDNSDDVAPEDAKEDGVADVVGVWTRDDAGLNQVRSLDLRADKSFVVLYNKACLATNCDVEKGTYKVTKSTTGKTKYLRLSQKTTLLVRFAFTVKSGKLSLRDTNTQDKFTLNLQSDACAAIGGQCLSSPLDVTFPANCAADFGMQESTTTACRAFNQACCVPADRTLVSGRCMRSSDDSCTTDADCTAGGCGGELCYNPASGGGITTCDCVQAPSVSCGCVSGHCNWYK